MKILIVEDEKKLNKMVADYLTANGFTPVRAYDGHTGLWAARREEPDLVLLDIMLPGIDGLEVLRLLRQEQPNLPILMLTARSTETDKLAGLDSGADDYLTKPFSLKEMVARIRAVLRRVDVAGNPETGKALTVGDLRVDPGRRRVELAGKIVGLTSQQFSLLYLLACFPGRVFSREEILEKISGEDFAGLGRTIDVQVKNIRKALEPEPDKPRYLKTVWGVGYCLAKGGRN